MCVKTLIFLSTSTAPAEVHFESPSRKSVMIKEVIQSDDGQFYWIICQVDFEVDDEQVCETLLKMITELYLTVRDFAYASIWMEKYKQVAKKEYPKIKVSGRTCTVIMLLTNILICINHYMIVDIRMVT